MWLLIPDETDRSSLTLRIRPGVTKVIGRAQGADFIVGSAMVSRLHCRLTAREGSLEVEDLDSTNGTFVNDRRVARASLGPGDRLRLGRLKLRVEKK